MLAPTIGERNDDEVADVTEAAQRLDVGHDDIEVDEETQAGTLLMGGTGGGDNASIVTSAGDTIEENPSKEEIAVLEMFGDSSGSTGVLKHSQQQPCEKGNQSDTDSFSSDCDEEEKAMLKQQYAMGCTQRKKKKIPVSEPSFGALDIREKRKEKSQLSLPDKAEISALAEKEKKLASKSESEKKVNRSSSVSKSGGAKKSEVKQLKSGTKKREKGEVLKERSSRWGPPVTPQQGDDSLFNLTEKSFVQVEASNEAEGEKGRGEAEQGGGIAESEASKGQSLSKHGIDFSEKETSEILDGIEKNVPGETVNESQGQEKESSGSGQCSPAHEIEYSDISSDSDDTLVGEVKGVSPKKGTKVKTESQREAAASRRRRKRARDRETLRAAQGRAPPPVTQPPQAQKRKSPAELQTSGPKLSKPSPTSAAALCSRWLDSGNPSDIAPGSDLIDRHGPVTFQDLSLFSSVRRGLQGRNEVAWEGPDSPSPIIQPTQPHGLRLHVMGTDGLVTPAPAAVQSAVRRGEVPTDRFCLHSTRIIEMQRSVDLDENPPCSICSHPHLSKPPVLNVLVCSNEAVASVGIPQIITAQGIPQAKLPEFVPGDCFEVLMIGGGLEASPRDVIDRVYGKCRLPINFIINLGGDAVRQGESSKAVFSDLMRLKGFLLQDFRRNLWVPTKVLFTSPLQWAGEQHLFLDIPPQRPLSYSQRSELYSLARQIETHNDSLVTNSASLRCSLPRWCEFVTSKQESVVPGNFGRVRTIVQPVAKPSVIATSDGGLHLHKSALLLLVKSTFNFMRRPDITW